MVSSDYLSSNPAEVFTVKLCKKNKDKQKDHNVFNRINLGGNLLLEPLCSSRQMFCSKTRGLFHKTFSIIIYCHFAVNYGIFAFMSKFTIKYLAVTTNP